MAKETFSFEEAVAPAKVFSFEEALGEPAAANAPATEPEVVTSARPWQGAGAGRGGLNDPRRLDVARPNVTGSVLDGVNLGRPTVDYEANLDAMQKSASPGSVMFSPGRTKQAVDKQIELGELARRAGYESIPDYVRAQEDSERRQQFAEDNPNIGALASGLATVTKGTLNAIPAAAGFVNKTFVDPFLGIAGARMSDVPTAPGTSALDSMAKDFMPAVGKLKLADAWDGGVFKEWLAANVSAQVPQIAQSVYGVVNPAAVGAILPMMGAQAAGVSFAEGDDPRVAVSKGIVEMLSEGASFGVAEKVKTVLQGLPLAARQSVLRNVAQKALAVGGALTAQQLAGAVEESVAQLGGNALDIYASGKQKSMLDGVPEAAVIGAAVNTAMALPNVAEAARSNRPEDQAARALARELNRGELPGAPGPTLNPNLAAAKVMEAPSIDAAIRVAEQVVSTPTASTAVDNIARLIGQPVPTPELEAANVSAPPEIPAAVAEPIGSRAPEPAPVLDAGVGVSGVAEPALDAGGVRVEPASDAAPLGASTEIPAAVAPGIVAQARAPVAQPAPAEPAAAGPAAVEGAGVSKKDFKVGGRDPHDRTYERRSDGRLTRSITYPDGQTSTETFVTDKNGDETWVSNDSYEKGEFYPVQMSQEQAAAAIRDDMAGKQTAPTEAAGVSQSELERIDAEERIAKPASDAAPLGASTEIPAAVAPGIVAQARAPAAMPPKKAVEESRQEKAEREWTANYDRVSTTDDLTSLPIKDLERAENWAQSRKAREQRKGWDGGEVNQNLVSALQSEQDRIRAEVKRRNALVSPAPQAAAPTASWVIREKGTGKVIQETFSQEVVEKLNTAKYEAMPIQQHLAQMNRLIKEYGEEAVNRWARGEGLPTNPQNVNTSAQPAQKPREIEQVGPFGRDLTPIAQGGKPFKTKADADAFRKANTKNMRTVKQGKGFALRELTPKELAAREKAAKRIAQPRAGQSGVPISAHAFIADRGGLARDAMADAGFDRNMKVGNRWLFAGADKPGMTLAEAAELLAEAGYIREESEAAAADIIKRSMRSPQYTDEGWERIAEAERATRFEDHLAAQQDVATEEDPFGPAPAFTPAEVMVVPKSVREEYAALMAAAEDAGIDTESVLEEAARITENLTQEQYSEYVRQALTDAIANSRREADRGESAVQGREDAERGGAESRSPNAGRPGDAPSEADEGLTAPTQQEVLDQQQRREQADDLDQREQIQREASGFQLQAQAPEQRKDNTSDTFGGPSVDDFQKAMERSRKPGTATEGPDLFGGLTEQEAGQEEARLEDLRRQLVAIENRIVGAAGLAPDFIEQAMQSRKVPKELKDQRNELKAELRGARERLSEQRAEPAKTDKPATKIEDFGEKLPPARRALAAKLNEALSDDEISKLPLSQIWPLAENDAIEDPFAAAVAHTARASVPAKPRTAYKVKRWVESVQTVRSLAAKVLDGSVTREAFMSRANEYRLADFISKVRLLEQIDRAQWGRIGEVREAPDAIRYEDGKQIKTPMVAVTVDGRSQWLRGSGNVDDQIDAVKSLLGTEPAAKRMEFEIRTRRRDGTSFINKKGDSERRPLMEFATVEEARAAIKAKYNDLVQAWEDVKARDNISEKDVRSGENRARTGQDWRKGRDVTAEEFENTFGFRGGEFGKWVSQGAGAQERQFFLNGAYDALMDLSNIVGIPPKAISLNGTLGIAFGSRGGGWASAHFEPSNLVINLTKPRGAGALAHEWFHAMDNYFSRQRGGEVPFTGSQTDYRDNNYITHKPEPLMVSKDRPGSKMTKGKLEAMRAANPGSKWFAADKWIPDPQHPAGVRPEVEARFADLVDVLDKSPMAQRARLVDGIKESGDGYWSRTLERAARSFENYVISRMHEQGYHNDFLANVRPAEDTGKNMERYPYLLPDEIGPVAEAFAALFDTVQTKETDKGVAMFSRAQPFYSALSKSIEGMTPKALPGAIWKDGIKGLINKGSVKEDEVEWSGIREWLDLQTGKVSKEDVLAYLDGNGVQVQEVVLGAKDTAPRFFEWLKLQGYTESTASALDADKKAELTAQYERDYPVPRGTRYSQYTLPGGTNYREVLLTLPPSRKGMRAEQMSGRWVILEGDTRVGFGATEDLAWEAADRNSAKAYKSSHWDAPNVLAHIRLNDRVDSDGARVLFVEEIQSDYAQEGRKKGFAGTDTTGWTAKVGSKGASADIYTVYDADGNAMRGSPIARSEAEAIEKQRAMMDADKLPRAPFVESTDKWLTLALKRVITMAAQEGYDKVAFVNGEQSAERYDLSKQISRVTFTDNGTGGIGKAVLDAPPGFGELQAFDKDGRVVISKDIPPEQIEDYVGKEVAKRLLEGKPMETYKAGKTYRVKVVSGVDLKVGGEGMRAFYDKIVPTAANKLLAKLGGGKVEAVEFRGPAEGEFTLSGNDRDGVIVSNFRGFLAEGGEWVSDRAEAALFPSRDAARDAARFGPLREQPGFTITPAMREKASAGLPLFRKGADQTTGLTPTQFTQALSEAFGAKVADRLQAKGVVVPLADQTKLPAHVVPFLRDGDIVFGFYDPRTNRTYAVLENLTPDMVKGLAMHEVGVHYGFEAMLGADKYKQVMKQLDLMRRSGNMAVQKAHAEAVANAARPSQVPEETLAYLVENSPENSVIKDVIARIKAWLFREFGIGGKYLTTDDLTALARAAVQHAARTEPGGVEVPAFMRASDDPVAASAVAAERVAAFRSQYPATPPSGMSMDTARTWLRDRRAALDALVQELAPMADGMALPVRNGGTWLVSREARPDGSEWRITRFDKNMVPQGHEAHRAAADAVADLVTSVDVSRLNKWNPAFMRAYHGTPHSFDKFSIDKIGTGEGAQAFGWGLYFAGKKEVAQHYRKALSEGRVSLDGAPADGSTPRGMGARLIADLMSSGMSFKEAKEKATADAIKFRDAAQREADALQKRVGEPPAPGWGTLTIEDSDVEMERQKARYYAERANALESIRDGSVSTHKGNLYEVEIPEEGEYLLWDKPLDEQPQGVNKAIQKVERDRLISIMKQRINARAERVKSGENTDALDRQIEVLREEIDAFNLPLGGTGERYYKSLSRQFGGDRAASEYLASIGVKGIKYLDGTSRADGDGTYNYVIFSADDVEIQNQPAFSRTPQTETKAFKDWFAGSKVVDAEGRPLVVYHGTNGDFSEFNTAGTMGRWGNTALGAFFAKDSDVAEEYGKTVMPVFLSLKNPYQMPMSEWANMQNTASFEEAKALRDRLVAEGYDGIVGHEAYIAFRPEQIKSATGNRGTFNPADPDIRFSRTNTAPTADGASESSRTPQTETKAFKDWFGDSVVTESGKAGGAPRAVYHGNADDITAFQDDKGVKNDSGWLGRGFYFTTNPNTANTYANIKAGSGAPNVMPVYLSIKNPYVATLRDKEEGALRGFGGKTEFAIQKRAELIAQGYDGVVLDYSNGGFAKEKEYVAFRPEQIKSATGNRGTFNPADPDIRFSRTNTAPTADADPVRPELSPWRDATGRLQFAPGAWLAAKYGDTGKGAIAGAVTGAMTAGPVGAVVGAAVGAGIGAKLSQLQLKAPTPELRRIMRQMKLDVAKAQEVAAAVAGEATKLTEDERAMVSDLIEKELKAGTIPPEHAVRLAAMINSSMEQQTNELVRLGMLTKDSADRWRGQYLPRYYESKLTEKAGDLWADAMRSITRRPSAMKGIKGKHLRGRGLYETIPESQLEDYKTMGWEVRDPDYQQGVTTDGTVQVWRDFTRQERDKMGEIRDAGFRFVMGYMQTQKDIALGKMFEQLAIDPEMSSRLETEKFSVRVPDGKAPGTETKTYGKLAGRWVSPETLSQLSLIEESQSEALLMYRKALGIWKEGKTVLNPVSHVNNTISNMSMAHFAGVSYGRADKYLAAIRDFAKKAPMILEAKDNGLFLGTLSEAELMNTLPEELKVLAQKQEGTAEKVGRTTFNLMTFYLRRPMGWAYQAEDTFFRYLIYKDARERGMEPQDAVDYAQKYIFTYDDLPKTARRIRDFGVPFFAYTYKAIPVLLHTALTHPERLAAPAAVLWTINAAAYAIAAGDDEDDWDVRLRRYLTDPEYREKARAKEKLERELLPEWNKGTTSLMTPKVIRLGNDELTKLPLFIDVSRIIPGGDLFDVNPNAGGIGLPQPITPSHPLFTTAVAMLANKDLFFGKDLTDSNDTAGEKFDKRAAWMWKQLTPAIAVNNYHWERGMNALAQAAGGELKYVPDFLGGDATGIGRDGLPVQPKLAAMQTFGIKVRPYDLDAAESIQESMRQKMIRDIDVELRKLKRLENKGAVSDRTAEKERELANLKKDRLRDGKTVDGEDR